MAFGKIRRLLCRKSGDGSMSGIRSWVTVLFLVRSRKAVSCFRRWLLWKSILEPQDVACGLPLVGGGIMDADRVDQAQFREPGEVFVQGGDRHFRIVGKPRLRREAAEIRVVTVAEKRSEEHTSEIHSH